VIGSPILSVDGLTKRYGRLTVLDGVSFSLDTGSIVALLGANGAGKTTTFKCVLGMTDFRGKIAVGGKSVAKAGKEVRRLIGYLPQTPGFADDDTCFEALRFLADLRRVPADRIGPLLERVNLVAQRNVRIRELSGGMRQRLALAAALLSDPPLLLLDEPTANLDLRSREELHDSLLQLRAEGRTVVLSTHFVEHVADIADRVILLKDGTVELDETAAGLRVAAGKQFNVNLNGTAPASFLAALRTIGIGEDRVSATRPDLQEAISRALADRNAHEGSDR
jgi:ABC-type multidrug transport system ATPase subunit